MESREVSVMSIIISRGLIRKESIEIVQEVVENTGLKEGHIFKMWKNLSMYYIKSTKEQDYNTIK